MVSESKQTHNHSNSRSRSQELLDAIENINKFNRHNAESKIPNFYNVDIKEDSIVTYKSSPLKKMIDLTTCLISSAFSDKIKAEQNKKRLELHEKLLQSIEIIKDHHFVLEKYRIGTPAQQKVAETSSAVINHFNAIVTQAEKPSPSFTHWLARFLYKQSGWLGDEKLSDYKIDIPSFSCFSRESPLKEGNKIKGLSLLMTCKKSETAHSPTPQEADAFRMKAITMIRNQDQPSRSIQEAMHQVRQAPITPEVISEHSVINFQQTLNPLPGEIIQLEGSFKRDPTSSVPSVPIPTSFKLSSASIQTGFPHPSQHHGWGLSDELIPMYPRRLGLLPLLHPLYKKKWNVAKDLLPTGNLYDKAREWLNLKRQVFDQNRKELLNLHLILSKAILSQCRYSEESIEIFYSQLDDLLSSFSHLSLTHQTINDIFIQRPFNRLQDEWLEKRHRALYVENKETRYEVAKEILVQDIEKGMAELKCFVEKATSPLEKATIHYILTLGDVIGKATPILILQQMSEKIGFAPPSLSLFEKKLQTACLNQMVHFFEELTLDHPSDPIMLERLKNLIQADISLFQSDDNLSPLIQEIEDYYCTRAIK